MKGFYERIYHDAFIWQLKLFGENNDPKWKALLFVSTVMFTNTLAISGIIEDVFMKNGFKVYPNGKFAMVYLVLLVLINWMRFAADGKHEKVIEKFSTESEKQQKISFWLSFAYFVASFPLIFISNLFT